MSLMQREPQAGDQPRRIFPAALPLLGKCSSVREEAATRVPLQPPEAAILPQRMKPHRSHPRTDSHGLDEQCTSL